MSYPITDETLDLILKVTRIENADMIKALRLHFVEGQSQAAAGAAFGIKRQQISPHIKRIRDELKPIFDDYAEAVHRPKTQG